MRTISFKVNEQAIAKDEKCDFSGIVANTKGYLKAKFSFNRTWNGFATIAVFRMLSEKYPVPIINGECLIPTEALRYEKFYVSVMGRKKTGEQLVTNEVEIIQESGGGL